MVSPGLTGLTHPASRQQRELLPHTTARGSRILCRLDQGACPPAASMSEHPTERNRKDPIRFSLGLRANESTPWTKRQLNNLLQVQQQGSARVYQYDVSCAGGSRLLVLAQDSADASLADDRGPRRAAGWRNLSNGFNLTWGVGLGCRQRLIESAIGAPFQAARAPELGAMTESGRAPPLPVRSHQQIRRERPNLLHGVTRNFRHPNCLPGVRHFPARDRGFPSVLTPRAALYCRQTWTRRCS
jgi:hypothetical protein